jgi:hypothetical protein
MEILRPYDVNTFNRLPGLLDADVRFRGHDGADVVSGPLQDLFMKYKLTETFGLNLLHRHFKLKQNQVLVAVNGSATPWNIPDLADSNSGTFKKYGGCINPCSWLLVNGHLVPYEFKFEPPNPENQQSTQGIFEEIGAKFVQEFARVLKEHNLTSSLGLCLVDKTRRGQLTYEVTEGRTTISWIVPDAKVPELLSQIQASWNYEMLGLDDVDVSDKPFVQRRCQSICSAVCTTSDEGVHTRAGHDNYGHYDDSDDDDI